MNSLTKWDKERVHAEREIARAQRERAIQDIVAQIQRHEIRLHELTNQGVLIEALHWEQKAQYRGSYDPVFGWR